MDKELIERICKEAGILGILSGRYRPDETGAEVTEILHLAALVAEECAKIAESDYLSMLATQTAHYRQSPTPFDQSRFGFQPDAIGAGRRAAGVIRTKFPAPANTPKE